MKELTLEAKIDNIPEATAFVDAWLEALDCPIKLQMQIDVAVDELFTNVASYAYPQGGGEVTLRLAFDEASRTASVTFVDGGAPFNPLERADPDVTLSAEERQIGGLGIFLVKKTMDGMDYRREGDFNTVTIHKKI